MQHRLTARGPVSRLFKEQRGLCFYCGRAMHLIGEWSHPLFATLEHRTPRILGGADNGSNFAASCSQCNSIKSGMPEPEFLAYMTAYGRDIYLVTIELKGKYAADHWAQRSAQPIPLQPIEATIRVSAPKPKPAVKPRPKLKRQAGINTDLKAIPQPYLPRVSAGGDWKVHLYDLKIHSPVDLRSHNEMAAKACAVTYASKISRGDIRTIICRVTDPSGRSSFMYQRGGNSAAWDWSPL